MAYAVRISGDKATARRFERAGVTTRDLSAPWGRIRQSIARDARRLVPVRTGALRRSIRPNPLQRDRAAVRAGGPRVVYAGIQNYGGIATGFYGPHEIRPSLFMNRALLQNRDYATGEIRSGIDGALQRAGF